MKIEFKGIYGQQGVIEFLTTYVHLLREEKVDSLFLEFVGPEGVGKLTSALEFAAAVNCEGEETVPCEVCPHCVQMLHLQHPDLMILLPDMDADKWDGVLKRLEPRLFYSPIKQIKIDEIRSVEKELWRERPYSGRYRFVIVANGENLNQYAQNAFLKTLEEPYPRTVVIFIVSKPERILPTIHSRARKVRFNAVSFKDFQQYFETLDLRVSLPLLYRITFGSIGKAKRYVYSDFIRARSIFLKALREVDIQKLLELFKSPSGGLSEGQKKPRVKSEKYIEDFIDFYGTIGRDLLYTKSYLQEFIINSDLKDEIGEFAKSISEDRIIEMLKIYRELPFWLRANVDDSVIPYALIAPIVGRTYQDVFRNY